VKKLKKTDCKVKMKLKKNDMVKIMSGKNANASGRIIRIDADHQKIYIEGQNLVKKAMKKRKQNQKAGIVEVEAPVHMSNVRIVCKK
jgi:large subunit ribosomal protein L24